MVPLWRDAEAGVRVVRLVVRPEIQELVGLFKKIAAAEGWEPGGALELWQERSVYFGLEVNRRLVGGLQLVRPDDEGTLPYQTIWPEVPLGNPKRRAHAAVLALDEQVRGQSLLFWRLVVEMWRHAVGEGISSLSLEVTPRVLPIYRRMGWPLEVRGELRCHWGEDCYFCTLGVPEVAEALLRRAEHSRYYREIIAQAFRVSLPSSERREAVVEPSPTVVAAW